METRNPLSKDDSLCLGENLINAAAFICLLLFLLSSSYGRTGFLITKRDTVALLHIVICPKYATTPAAVSADTGMFNVPNLT